MSHIRFGLILKEFHAIFRFIKVGSYDGSAALRQQLQIEQSTIVWTKGQSQVGHMSSKMISYLSLK